MSRHSEEPGSAATDPGPDNSSTSQDFTTSEPRHDSAVNPSLETALRLASLGFYVGQAYGLVDGVCSCGKGTNCEKPGKHPVGGKQSGTLDAGELRRRWGSNPHANLFIDHVQSGTVDVSSDNEHWFNEFERRGWPEGMLSYRSGGGPFNQHNVMRRPEDCPVTNSNDPGQFDYIANGIGIVPPSVSSKGEYVWISEPVQRDRLPEAPAWAVLHLWKKQAEKEARQEPIDEDEPPVELTGDDLLYWTGEKSKWTTDANGDTVVARSDTLTEIANVLARAGLKRRAIRHELEERDLTLYSDHPNGPKYANRPDADIRYTELANSAERMFGTAGMGGFKNLFGTEPDPEDPDTLFGITALGIDGVLDRADPVWTVRGLLQSDTMAMVAGDYGTYKSFLTLGLAMSIALGQPWFGHQIKKPGPVVYIVAEGSSSFKLRIEAFMKKHGVSREELRGKFYVVPHEVVITDKRWIEALNLRIEALNLTEEPALVVLDTLSRTFGSTHKENDPDGMRAYVDGMNAVRRRFDGCVSLVVHHFNKSGGIRGANVLPADLTTILETKLAGDRTVTVSCTKQKDADEFPDFYLRPERVDLRPPGIDPFIFTEDRDSVVLVPSSRPKSPDAVNKPHGHKLEDSDRALIAALHAAGKERTGKELVDALSPGTHRTTIKRRLEILRDTPMVNHLNASDDGSWLTGAFTLTDEGRAVYEAWQTTPESPS